MNETVMQWNIINFPFKIFFYILRSVIFSASNAEFVSLWEMYTKEHSHLLPVFTKSESYKKCLDAEEP